MTSYSLWLAALVIFLVQWLLEVQRGIDRVRALISTALLGGAVFVGGFWGWLILVLAEAVLFAGKSGDGRRWGLNFTSLIPGILIYFQHGSAAVTEGFLSAALILYFFLRSTDWPVKNFADFPLQDTAVRHFALVWCTAAAFLLTGHFQQAILLPGISFLLLLSFIAGERQGIIVLAWAGMTVVDVRLAPLGAGLFLGGMLSGWWKVAAIVFFSLGWSFTDWLSLELPAQILVCACAGLTGLGFMTAKEPVVKKAVLWTALVSSSAAFLWVLLMDLQVYQIAGRSMLTFLPAGLGVIGGVVGGIWAAKKPDWHPAGWDLLPYLQQRLEETSIDAKPAAEFPEFLAKDEKRPLLGETGQYFVWLLLVTIVAMVGQWLV